MNKPTLPKTGVFEKAIHELVAAHPLQPGEAVPKRDGEFIYIDRPYSDAALLHALYPAGKEREFSVTYIDAKSSGFENINIIASVAKRVYELAHFSKPDEALGNGVYIGNMGYDQKKQYQALPELSRAPAGSPYRAVDRLGETSFDEFKKRAGKSIAAGKAFAEQVLEADRQRANNDHGNRR